MSGAAPLEPIVAATHARLAYPARAAQRGVVDGDELEIAAAPRSIAAVLHQQLKTVRLQADAQLLVWQRLSILAPLVIEMLRQIEDSPADGGRLERFVAAGQRLERAARRAESRKLVDSEQRIEQARRGCIVAHSLLHPKQIHSPRSWTSVLANFWHAAHSYSSLGSVVLRNSGNCLRGAALSMCFDQTIKFIRLGAARRAPGRSAR